MSRELMLIPKARYEQMLKNEEDGKEKAPTLKENEINQYANDNTSTHNSQSVDKHDQPKRFESETFTEVRKKLTKQNKPQKGGGKPYVVLPPTKMLKLQKSKTKWLSFKF